MSGTPTIGRIVHYRLSEQDAERVERQRIETDEHRRGFNTACAGDVYPATVVRANTGNSVNLQVHLDGPDTLWVTSRGLDGLEPGCWFWPPRVDMTREGR